MKVVFAERYEDTVPCCNEPPKEKHNNQCVECGVIGFSLLLFHIRDLKTLILKGTNL
jgi:hypothetical protein